MGYALSISTFLEGTRHGKIIDMFDRISRIVRINLWEVKNALRLGEFEARRPKTV
jgi:hypothetical protein